MSQCKQKMLKLTERLCVMAIKNDLKLVEGLASRFKIDTKKYRI